MKSYKTVAKKEKAIANKIKKIFILRGMAVKKIFLIPKENCIEIYVFFSTEQLKNAAQMALEKDELQKAIAAFVVEILGLETEIRVFLDSQENVAKNYEGNYYYRLL